MNRIDRAALRGQSWGLRIAVYDKIREWRGHGHNRFRLAALLGHRHYKDYILEFNDRDTQICEALLSPHGYTVYKMLLARWNRTKNEL